MRCVRSVRRSTSPTARPGDGDRFYVRYEQTFTVEGQPIGVGRVLWAELNSAAKGTIALYRFRPVDGVERLWLASGEAAPLPAILLPLDVVNISSGFGPRADPLGRSRGAAAKAPGMGPFARARLRLGLSHSLPCMTASISPRRPARRSTPLPTAS